MPGHLEDEFIKKELDTVPSGSKISTFSFSFFTWCMAITRWTLATRTGFSRYLGSTLCLRRDGPPAPSTALLPLPLPAFWPYAGSPNNPKKRKDKEGAVTRALHVVICAVNYMYYARSCPPLELIRRQPNQCQSEAIQRLRLFVKACDHGQLIEVAASGGKNLQLMARLQELASAAEALGISQSPYVEDIRPQKVCPDKGSTFSFLKPETREAQTDWNRRMGHIQVPRT